MLSNGSSEIGTQVTAWIDDLAGYAPAAETIAAAPDESLERHLRA